MQLGGFGMLLPCGLNGPFFFQQNDYRGFEIVFQGF